MNTIMKLTRRGFLKVAGVMTAVSISGIRLLETAHAAAMDFVGQRQISVYDADTKVYQVRKSQDNPMIQKIYAQDGFLNEGPCGQKSHELLHTHYTDRSAGIKAIREKGIKLKL